MKNLPEPIAAYVEASNAGDPARQAACFTTDATISDEGKLQRGRAEITAWARDTGERYRATIDPLGLHEAEGRHHLHAAVSGNFPGSPIRLHFHFELADDGIRSLEVTP